MLYVSGSTQAQTRTVTLTHLAHLGVPLRVYLARAALGADISLGRHPRTPCGLWL
jgi:hypothetical protein